MGVVEQGVTVTTPDGQADAALFVPEGDGPWPAVLVWPDAMGLRPVLRQMGERLAESGYVVLVPNHYYRETSAPITEGEVDFSDPEQRERVMTLMRSVTPLFAETDSVAFVAFLDALAEVDSSKPMGVQGYCMGGALAFRSAAASDRFGAVASFHGGGLASDRPDSPHLSIPDTSAEYLVAIADNDHERDPEAKDTLVAAFDAVGRNATVEVYEGANHGWTVPGSAIYHEASAERAFSELLDLYARTLV